ncbi:MAG TPA: non-homologous end-joining DNA ligase [Tepidisphaeraceae bacterium]|jgi:bifunctional non-homologous end joining protein LigD
MLCTLVKDAFDDQAWIFEPKLDGMRLLVRFDGTNLTLLSRNQKSQNLQFPEIVEGLAESLHKPAILDGEIVSLDEYGQSRFRHLQQRFHVEDPSEIKARARRFPAYLYVFDILWLSGNDLTAQPLERRKAILKRAVAWSSVIRHTRSVTGKGIQMLRQACREGSEGIIAKRLGAPYLPGERSGDWLKIKCLGRQEFVIGGFTDPQRSRVGLGALLVGYYDDTGSRLIYAGKVGTGFTNEDLLSLRKQLDKFETSTNVFDEGNPPRGPQVHSVRPKLVAEIAYAEWTQNGLLRQPRFEGLRTDKSSPEVRLERPKSASNSHPARRRSP